MNEMKSFNVSAVLLISASSCHTDKILHLSIWHEATFLIFSLSKLKDKNIPRVCLTLSLPACFELCFSQVMPSISVSKLVGHDLKMGHKAD